MRFSESSPLRLHQWITAESLRRQRLVASARQAKPPCDSVSPPCGQSAPAGRTSASPHHHRERLGRAAHRAQESSRRARRTLTLFGRAPLALADELEVARVRRGRAAPELRRRHAGLGNAADDRHAAPFLLLRKLRRRLLAAPRSRRYPGPARFRWCSATDSGRRMPSSSISGRSSRSCFTPLRCREPRASSA